MQVESEKLADSENIADECAEPKNIDSRTEIVTGLIQERDEADAPIEMDCETTEATTTAMTIEEASASEEATATSEASAKEKESSNGLSLLATYSSDVDSNDEEEVTNANDDDVVEVPVTSSIPNTASAARRVVTVSSGSDSSCTYSDSDSEGEYLTVLRQKIEKRINVEDCDDDDDDIDGDDARPRRRQPPKVRGEMLLDELPPIEQLEITVPEDECIELGKVQSIVDQLVLVSVLPNSMLFDLDTVLFLEKGRKVLGQVFDVLGQVADPLYCVRFNSNEQIKERGINIGDIVYCAPQTEHTQFVILSKLMQVRGSDASWEHDVEPPARFVDYSDDEAEREARWEQRKKRQRERTNSTDSVETVSTVTTETSEAPSSSVAPRQRGRRTQRDNRQSNTNHNGNPHQQHHQSRSQSRDSEYNYHPSYNPGSWHSNYYHNYHPPAANFNMMPGMGFPVPMHGYGYPPAPHPYAMPPPPMHMGMPPPPPPSHMYPPQHHQHPPPHYGPPRSGN